MEPLRTLGLFVLTVIAELVGCYMPYPWLKQGRSPRLLLPAAISLAVFAWLFVSLLPQPVAYGETTQLAKRPNIVLIMADDLGYETLGCYGGKDYKTPNLDRLAAHGIRFDHCYSQPLCTPSRVQIMTGRYNHRNYEGFGYLNPNEVTFANLLKQVGYQTCIAGKWQLSGNAATIQHFGFDEHCLWNMHVYKEGEPDAEEPENWLRRYDSPALYENGEWTEYGEDAYGPDVCNDFVCSFIAKKTKEPFFVYYPMMLTHDPFVITPASDITAERNRKSNFVDMVQYMDTLVGRIVTQLERSGLRDTTLILFTGDNGTHTAITSNHAHGEIEGGKARMINAGTRVPFIASWQGTTPEGRVSDDLIDFSDFLPTLCAAGNCALPNDRVIDGQSFLPQLLGDPGQPREWIFCHYWGERGRAMEGTREYVRNKRWKLYDTGELYDIQADVLEQSPVSALDPDTLAMIETLNTGFKTVHTE